MATEPTLSKTFQINFFEQYKVNLKVSFRSKQHDYKNIVKSINQKGKWLDIFAQMCDQLNLKRNYAKSYERLVLRLASKLSAMSILHWNNHLNGEKNVSNQTCFEFLKT